MTNSHRAGGGGVAPATATASEESSDESNTDDENVHAHMHQILKVVEQARGQHFQRENPSQESPPPVNGTSPQPVFRDVAPSPGREPLSGSTGTKPPIVDRPSGSEICTWSSYRSAFVIFAWADDPKWGGTQATPRQGSTPWTVPPAAGVLRRRYHTQPWRFAANRSDGKDRLQQDKVSDGMLQRFLYTKRLSERM